MIEFFHTYVYIPLYNALIALFSLGTWVDMGIAIILLTVVVKLLLFPLSLKAVRTQRLMKELEEPVREIKEKYKDDREKQGRELLALYKKYNINPFSSIMVMLLQLPIVISLYLVFFKNELPKVQTDILYSFVHVPDHITTLFLGSIDMAGNSYLLAVLAGITQYLQAHYSMPPLKPRGDTPSIKEELARSMHVQIKYILPIFVAFIAHAVGAAVALYLITSNIFTIGQELYIKHKYKEHHKENK